MLRCASLSLVTCDGNAADAGTSCSHCQSDHCSKDRYLIVRLEIKNFDLGIIPGPEMGLAITLNQGYSAPSSARTVQLSLSHFPSAKTLWHNCNIQRPARRHIDCLHCQPGPIWHTSESPSIECKLDLDSDQAALDVTEQERL